jgi:hypothetical protein
VATNEELITDDIPSGSKHAMTERGSKLDRFTEDDVNAGLKTLILHGGNVKQTVEALGEEGVLVKNAELRYWRDVAFPTRYYALRKELSAEVGEEVAGRAMEKAIVADDAESLFIEKAVEKADDISPDRLTAAARDMSQVKAQNIEKAQLLRNKPTQIQETRDTAELLNVLRKLGILTGDPRDNTQGPETIEGNASPKK